MGPTGLSANIRSASEITSTVPHRPAGNTRSRGRRTGTGGGDRRQLGRVPLLALSVPFGPLVSGLRLETAEKPPVVKAELTTETRRHGGRTEKRLNSRDFSVPPPCLRVSVVTRSWVFQRSHFWKTPTLKTRIGSYTEFVFGRPRTPTPAEFTFRLAGGLALSHLRPECLTYSGFLSEYGLGLSIRCPAVDIGRVVSTAGEPDPLRTDTECPRHRRGYPTGAERAFRPGQTDSVHEPSG